MTDEVKRIVGSEKTGPPVEFKFTPSTKIYMVTGHEPKINSDGKVWRRLREIEKDEEIK